MLYGGRVGDRQIVPERWIDGISDGAAPSKFGEPYSRLSPAGGYWRFWWAHDPVNGVFKVHGVFGQVFFVGRSADVLIAKISSWPDYLLQHFSHDAVLACEAIIKVLD